MTTYTVVTGHGDLLCNGVSEFEIQRVAQEHADRLAETVYYYSEGGADADDGDDIAVEPTTVRCECGCWSGERCAWTGPREETVIVEWMPKHLRASHDAANNRGVYPHNGAERIRVERSCADWMIEHDGDWCELWKGG